MKKYEKEKNSKLSREAATRRESLISNIQSQSLYEWYKYLKQSGRFNLADWEREMRTKDNSEHKKVFV